MFCLLGDGRVFSWGSGNYGHLGHSNLRDRYAPLWVDRPLRGVKVTDIACYECHSAAISGTSSLSLPLIDTSFPVYPY